MQAGTKPAIDLEKPPTANVQLKQPAFGEAETDAELSTPRQPQPTPGRIFGGTDLLSAVTSLRVDNDADFDTAGAKEAELAQKGLAKDKPELMRIEVKRQPMGGFNQEAGFAHYRRTFDR